jgi:hypothetical protein
VKAVRQSGVAGSLSFVVAVFCVIAALAVHVPVAAASSTRAFLPYVVVRAGDSNVVYALWQKEGCFARSCVRLERSNNGGRTFVNVSVPPIAAITPGMEGVTPVIDELTFANASVGYAVEAPNNGSRWQGSSYFGTTNGARSWHKVTIGPHPYNFGVVTTHRYVYALTAECPTKGAQCGHFALRRAEVGTDAWTTLAIPPTLLEPRIANLTLAAYGSTLWVAGEDKSSPYPGVLATSHNAGASFTTDFQRNLQSPGNCGLLPMSTSVVWANCWQGMDDDSVVYSHDGGEKWQAQTSGPLVVGSVAAFDPISARTAYFINGSRPDVLDRIADEASRPVTVGSLPQGHYWSTLVFTNARDGLALTRNDGPNLQLWGTDTAGQKWWRVRV